MQISRSPDVEREAWQLQNILRRPAVERITGLSRSSIYEGIGKGTFPQPVKSARKP